MLVRLFHAVLTTCLLALPAAAAELLRGPVPGWVEPVAAPEPDADLAGFAAGGVYYQLLDGQMAWDGEARLYHYRLVTRVLSRAGLEETASVLRDFDPASETLTLTRLDIVRDGRRIDLKDGVEARLLRREEDLESGIIDGLMTAHLEVPDLRVGDTLDVAVLWRTEPLFAGQTRSARLDTLFSEPVGLLRIAVNWPEGWPLAYAPQPAGLRIGEEAVARGRRIVLTRPGQPPPGIEDDLPPEFDPWGAVTFTAARGWDEIAAALAGHYGAGMAAPAAWAEEIDAIRAGHPTPADRAFAALRLVQDRVRYVGVEIGAGGWFARAPDDVVAQGFGDCKDKAALLVTLLRALGIPADVALTHIDAGHGLDRALPSALAFDHMIVRATLGDRAVWMDPTATHGAGSLWSAGTPDYGFALPLTGASAGLLEPIRPRGPGENTIATYQTFRFLDDGADFDVVTEFSAGAADRQRGVIASTPPRELERDYLKFYDGHYPGIEKRRPAEFSDDADRNVVTVREYYRLPPEARDDPALLTEFPFFAEGFDRQLPDPRRGGRGAPFYLGLPRERLNQVRVENAPIEFDPPDDVSVSAPGFEFHFSGAARDGGNMTLRWHFRGLRRTIAPAELPAYREGMGRMKDASYIVWDLTPDEG